MAQLPEYRVRLFLSADLVGSTAFKAKVGDGLETRQTYPAWAVQIRKFYSEFPNIVESIYAKRNLDKSAGDCPRVWKTLGDEILLCVKLISQAHAFRCIDDFLCALREYGNALERSKTDLDVKGCAWIATFPTPNVAVRATKLSEDERTDQIGEELEKDADRDPTRFDFLGKSIDTGFRISQYSSASLCALSIDLAWLVANHCHAVAESNTLSFSYTGRFELKGIAGGRPYPVVHLEAERSAIRREIVSREYMMRGVAASRPIHVRDFAHSFMLDAGIEVPVFGEEQLPASYIKFAELWHQDAEDEKKTITAMLDEGEPQEDLGGYRDLPAEVEEAIDAAVLSAEDSVR